MAMNRREWEVGFSLNKQADIETPVTVAQINKKVSFRSNAPSQVDFPDQVSDADWYGKGNSFATFWDRITQRVIVPSREYSLSPLMALWAGGFVFGSLSSTQPDSGGAPSVYDHAFTFQDPETNPEVLYTSMIEEAGQIYQKKLTGLAVNQFSLTGEKNDHVRMSWDGVAREISDDTSALPAITAQTFFKLLGATFSFGASGGAAAISPQVSRFEFGATQNIDPQERPGNPSGEEGWLTNIWIGDQRVSGSLTVDLLEAHRNLFLNQTECELTITLLGPVITGALRHTVTIAIPHFHIPSESFPEVGQLQAYQIPIDGNTVLKAAGEDYCTFTVRSNIDTSEILVEDS